MLFLSQAWRLGGLHLASPVPFRASYFTPALHPAGATAQRLIAYLYRRRDFPSIPSPRFVAHKPLRVLQAVRKEPNPKQYLARLLTNR
jgi:hypothetical protein